MTRARIRQRAELEVDADSELRAIGQEIALAQALVHLLNNAALACPLGHAAEHRVRVELREDGDDVLIVVEDDGCGMDEGTVRQAFDPFFTTRPVGSGSGLGLSIAHGAISGMGGSIELESWPWVGTRATVRLAAAGAALPVDGAAIA